MSQGETESHDSQISSKSNSVHSKTSSEDYLSVPRAPYNPSENYENVRYAGNNAQSVSLPHTSLPSNRHPTFDNSLTHSLPFSSSLFLFPFLSLSLCPSLSLSISLSLSLSLSLTKCVSMTITPALTLLLYLSIIINESIATFTY